MAEDQAPPGWYPNPDTADEELYWDGTSWTLRSRPTKAASRRLRAQTGAKRVSWLWLIFDWIVIVILIDVVGGMWLGVPSHWQGWGKVLAAGLVISIGISRQASSSSRMNGGHPSQSHLEKS